MIEEIGELIADCSDLLDEFKQKNSRRSVNDAKEEEDIFGVKGMEIETMRAKVKEIAKQYLLVRERVEIERDDEAAEQVQRHKEELKKKLEARERKNVEERFKESEREIEVLRKRLIEKEEDCELLIRAVKMARAEFHRLEALEEEEEEYDDDDDDDGEDVGTLKSVVSSGGATYGSHRTNYGGGGEGASIHDMLDLDEQYYNALEKLKRASISSLSQSNSNVGGISNDKVTETAKAAAVFAATAAIYTHSGSVSAERVTTSSIEPERVATSTTEPTTTQTLAIDIAVDDEKDGEVFRTPIMVVSDHPDALSSSEDEDGIEEGINYNKNAPSMQEELDRILFMDVGIDAIDSPSTITKPSKIEKTGMTFLNALPPRRNSERF